MTDQKLEPVWIAPSTPWWHSGMKVAALVLLVNALALEWAAAFHPELQMHVFAGLSLLCAMLLGAWSMPRYERGNGK